MEIEDQQDQSKHAIPLDIRWKIVHYKSLGESGTQVQQRLSIPASTYNAIYRKYKETGDVTDKPRSGRPKKFADKEKETLIETTEEHPEMTLNQLIEESKTDFSKTTS